ncbi:RdRP-domain-containing protein [Tricholoma matsutake]|nr:RdRP-domain-containing protein [Tricholoma matsutake 945]
MDLAIRYLPSSVNEWDVTRVIAQVVHSDEFTPRRQNPHAVDRPINFRVKLNPSKAGGVGNDGSGTLTLPTPEAGNRFLRWVDDRPIRIEGKKVKFRRSGHPMAHLAATLDKTPYVDPDLEEEHQKKVWELQDPLRVDAVQFGFFYRPKYPSNDRLPLSPRAFSIEWEHDCVTESSGWLAFEYDHKVIRLKLGNPIAEKLGSSIAISFRSIQKIGVGYDVKPYICFDTLTPPVLEQIQFHRSLTGSWETDNSKFKHRLGSLHPGHQVVAPYASNLRVILYNDTNIDMIDKFVKMCRIAGLGTENMILRCAGLNQIEASKREFFTAKQLYHLMCVFRVLPWPVAFQLESLLHNGLLHTKEVKDLIQPVRTLCGVHRGVYVGDLLRRFNEALQARSVRESPANCFQRVCRDFDFVEPNLSPGYFRCCHVTFTPTRMILEGPYATQSNRVLRKYRDYEDHFLRVDFRDEDRLQYRWEREVDGTSFLKQRVGGILKEGFELAGRRFEFLAYSSSALREHAVWFMNPIELSEGNVVTAEDIRSSQGDFDDTPLKKCPSKYAARLAQAFTATDPSVEIRRDQWEIVDDLGTLFTDDLFTDGVGTISKELGNRIWDALCKARRDKGKNATQPSAYQIRFLGFKGVVAVDEQLDGNPNGILMRLRPSMKKFENSQAIFAPIEIAQSFEHPNTCYLNRPLVMILEDLGVRMEAFIELQEQAVAEALTIDDSNTQFRNILDSHGLGRPYRLSHTLKRIEELGLELNTNHRAPGFDTPFLRQVRQVSRNDVLRDIKHSARIPIPDSYLLVGVADEGPAYENAGHTNVYKLKEGNIFACIQKSKDSEPVWLEGACSISRSPVAHPGDVQRVFAIGKPPEGKLCLFAHMKNVVVLPSRSLASCLGGGDLDGDLFAIIQHKPLLPSKIEKPDDYLPGNTLELDRESTVNDICDFIVEYIHSDVLGLLSDRLLIIGDQSKEGMLDEDCRSLAKLCSQAVDYPKKGIPVDISEDKLPKTLIRCKPDWHAAEVVAPRRTDYYESIRALGVMYRSIKLDEPQPNLASGGGPQQPLTDPISVSLSNRILPYLQPDIEPDAEKLHELVKMFGRYVDELRYICATHTISDTPGVRLLEAEVVAGTILAKCSQKRWRKDRTYRMRLHATTLVRDVQQELAPDLEEAPRDQLIVSLMNAWYAWGYSLRRGNDFGANSFGLITLDTIFDCLEKLSTPV